MYYEVLFLGEWGWNLSLLFCLTIILGLYLFLLRRFNKQLLYFLISLGLFYLTIGSPFTQLSHLSFSLHMLQMSILYFIVPPMLLLAFPDTMFKAAYNFSLVKKMRKFLIAPKKALLLFAIFFTLYHLPVVLKIISQSTSIQNGYVILLFLLSFSMWWPIVSPDIKQRFEKKKMNQFAHLSGWLLMPACLLLIFRVITDGFDNPFLTQMTIRLCLPNQMDLSQLIPPPFNTKFDQLLAGFLMLGIHKFSLMGSCHLGSKAASKNKEYM